MVEIAISENLWQECSMKGLKGRPLDFETSKSLIASLLTMDGSTKTFDNRTAETGQISIAPIAMNPLRLYLRILTVSLKISKALVD